MINKFRDIDAKNRKYYFFDDTTKIKNLDPHKVKIDESSYKGIPIHNIKYMTFKDLRYTKCNNANPLYLIVSKINGYFERIYENIYLMPVLTDECNQIMKNYEELWIKIKKLTKFITGSSDDYVENHMKIKFNQDYDFISIKG